MEGDGIMGEIFESIQDEVKGKSRLLKGEREKVRRVSEMSTCIHT